MKNSLAASLYAIAFLGVASLAASGSGVGTLPNPLTSVDGSGVLSTYSTTGPIDTGNPFFQSLGTNGRTCNSCHVSSTAWTVSPPEIQARFEATKGTDPIFRPVDGATCPDADVSTFEARTTAYSQLLEKGLIRISLPVPAAADFQIVSIDDPYGC